MPDAYNHFVQVATQGLSKVPDDDFLLVGSNMPLLSTVDWESAVNKIMIGKAIAYRGILLRKTIINENITSGKEYQYYGILKEKSSGKITHEPLGNQG
jgi:hypothetical protein